MAAQEQMNIVIVGHVDHGKSTFIGRLLADTDSLPKGKLEQVKATCERNAKPFEYAFLLDALKDEQSQGITIDSARCFFKTEKRHYIIIDAPGHIEFLKNMISGAARAEAAVLMIDAKEGVKENSRRHGFMLSLLGIKQVVVVVNKMDLVDYDEAIYRHIIGEYTDFLNEIDVTPKAFVPISAFQGENLTKKSDKMAWYMGPSVLDLIDDFEKEEAPVAQAFRLPIQDVYKFTESGDDRRIIAGTVETGRLSVGDDVILLPSNKRTKITGIEAFNTAEKTSVMAGEAIGLTMETQLYLKPGELMVKAGEQAAEVASTVKANLFWLGKKPLVKDKEYKIKCAAHRGPIYVKDIITVLDASNLNTEANKETVNRHDVAELTLQTARPFAFDLSHNVAATGRFVIIDDYEIAGGGIITEAISQDSRIDEQLRKREFAWERSVISAEDRAKRFGQKPQFILITGPENVGKLPLAKALDEALFKAGKSVYFLGISNMLSGVAADLKQGVENRDEHIRRLAETAHIITDAGLVLISTISNVDDVDIKVLRALCHPAELFVINVGENVLAEEPVQVNLAENTAIETAIEQIKTALYQKDVLLEYHL